MALTKLFQRIFFHNGTTPALNEDNMNAISKAIDDIDDRVISIADDVPNMESQISALNSRVNMFTHLAEGSTTGDAELMDIRVGANGTTYENAGTAVRSQVNALNEALTNETLARASADSSEASTRAAADTALGARIDNIIAPSGEAPSAAEVTDARVGADGTTYNSLGTAIRTNDTKLHKLINDSCSDITGISQNVLIGDFESGAIDGNTGEETTNNARARSRFLPLHPGQGIRFNSSTYAFILYKYDAFGNFISVITSWTDTSQTIIERGLYRILVSKKNATSDDISGELSAISSSFSIELLYPNSEKISVANRADIIDTLDEVSLGTFESGSLDGNSGVQYDTNTRVRSRFIPLNTNHIIHITGNIYEYALYKYDSWGNLISIIGWSLLSQQITEKGLYRILVRKASSPNADISSEIATINNTFYIQQKTKELNNILQMDGNILLSPSDFEVGGYYYQNEDASTNRLRSKGLLKVNKGSIVGINTGGLEMSAAVINPSSPTAMAFWSGWQSGVKNLLITADGFLYIQVRKSDNSNISLSDFNGYAYVSRKSLSDIVVDKNGNGDFTSFSEAVIAGYTLGNCNIYVNKGEYDVFDEIEAIEGEGFFDTSTQSDFLGGGLPFGNGMNIIGSPGAVIKFDGSKTENTDVHHYLAVIFGRYVANKINKVSTIKGLTFECKKIKYCIHFDEGAIENDYTYIVENCTLKIDNSQNTQILASNAVGMGGSINTTYIIRNNYIIPTFSVNARDNEALYYHNTNAASPNNKLIIENNYIDGVGTIRIDAYGESENECPAQINGNSVGSALLTPGVTKNIKYLAWNNEVRV